MKIPRIGFTAQRTAIERLSKLEKTGRYETALEELGEIWLDHSTLPEVRDFEPAAAAEMILRCGSLLGFSGHHKQTPGSQERSKDLLAEARRRFTALGETEKVAETENYLALAYWRLGAVNEAEIWLETSFAHSLPDTSKARLYSTVCKTLFQIDKGEFEKILIEYQESEVKFRVHGDVFLNGSLCSNYAVALKNLGRTSEALKILELAEFYHQQSKHKIYLGTVYNNFALNYLLEKRFDRAHEAIDRAREIFERIKDFSRCGFSLDTKAEIFFAAGDYDDALQTIETALKILKKGENASYIVGTLTTKAKILLYKYDSPAEAMICLAEAIEISRLKIDEKRAKRVVLEFEKMRERKNNISESQPPVTSAEPEKSAQKGETLNLILPPALARYTSIHGVWLSGNHLESYGLREGSLAIVANEKVVRGDLAAVLENETDTVVCGFYDEDFGIICLETASGEPQLFDANAVKILGKIVGVTNALKDREGKMLVEQIFVP